MPFNTKDVPDRLVEAVREGNVVPLIGAGISKQAGSSLPSAKDLLSQMTRHGVKKRYLASNEAKELRSLLRRDKHLMVAEELRSRMPTDEYVSFLEERFPLGARPAKIHTQLFNFRSPVFLTTNYDRLLEDAYARKFRKSAYVKTYMDTPSAQRYLQKASSAHIPLIFKLHGTIDDPDSLVLTEKDYRNLLYHQSGYRTFMAALFITHVILMLGFSVSDPELVLLLEQLREALKHRAHPDYAFLPASSVGKVEKSRLREDFGIEVITYEPTEGHPEVLQFVQYLFRRAKAGTSSTV